MRKVAFLISVLLLAPLAGAAPWSKTHSTKRPAAKPQVFQGEIWDLRCAKNGSHVKMAKELGLAPGPDLAWECTKECHKLGSPLVLYNPSTQRIYKLDDQKKVDPYAGAHVRVTGTLNAKKGIIHVLSITSTD